MPKATLADEIISRVRPVKTSYSWRDKLPAEVMREVDELKRRFQSGEFGEMNATRLSVAIVESLKDRGFTMSSPKRVREWLTNQS